MDVTTLPFSMKPVGWFQIGWSAEIASGTVKPLRYFGHDLVAFRTEDGELAVLDAHCKHLGAHLGHGGKVKGNCVACPYHGWQWAPDGSNAHVPNQEKPTGSRIRAWHVREQHECIFMWHDPTGSPPRWDIPHVFQSFEDKHGPEEYYPAYGNSTVKYAGEGVHPQIAMENAVDSAHFRYTHDAPADPVMLDYHFTDSVWTSHVGFKSVHTGEVALKLESQVQSVATSTTCFAGSYHYRLIFAVTPVDDHVSDMFYSIWFPREAGDESDLMPQHLRDLVRERFLFTLEEDLLIWRTQTYVPHPIFAKADIKTYPAIRRWQKGFYNLPSPPGPEQESAAA